MSFSQRCISQDRTQFGVVSPISARYEPVDQTKPYELVIDNNIFGRICSNNSDLLQLLAEHKQQSNRINPLASLLEQLASNKEQFPKKYRAFRKNCSFNDDYEELPLGSKEMLAVAFFSDSYRLELLALRCYALKCAVVMRQHKNANDAIVELRQFISQQPICYSVLGIFLQICIQVKFLASVFKRSSELRLIEKFFALPSLVSIDTIRDWGGNRARDLYMLSAVAKVSFANSHLGEPLAGGVAVVTADQFVAEVLFRYCCVGTVSDRPFAIDLDELVDLDPNLFDLLPTEKETWAHAKNGFNDPKGTAEFYLDLWPRMALEAVAVSRKAGK